MGSKRTPLAGPLETAARPSPETRRGSDPRPDGVMTIQPSPKHRELSVIAPCYNEADNLRELVARTLRVFEQKEIDGEIVLVDDGSRDATPDVIGALQSEHPG